MSDISRFIAALLLASATLVITSCGNKGDLYLPPAQEEVESSVPSSS